MAADLSPLRRRRLPGLALLAAASIAQAQGTPARTERPDPLDPRARVPAITTPLPLAGYRRLGDDQPVPWKQANETVNRIGGWRAYAREAQAPDSAASAPAARTPAPPASGAVPGHGGHQTH
jgi:hypothetical protein